MDLGLIFKKKRLPNCSGSRHRDSRSDPFRLRIVIRRNRQLLTDLNLVRIFQRGPVGVKDAHILVRILVEFLADLRERVTGFHCVSFAALSRATARCGAHRPAGVDTDVGCDVVRRSDSPA